MKASAIMRALKCMTVVKGRLVELEQSGEPILLGCRQNITWLEQAPTDPSSTKINFVGGDSVIVDGTPQTVGSTICLLEEYMKHD